MSTRLTASQIDRAHACPASFALPVVTYQTNGDAERGIAIHRFLEIAVSSGRDIALADISPEAPWRATCGLIDVKGIIGSAESFNCEVSFAYDPRSDSARVVGRSVGRDYSAVSEDEIAGTADLVLFALGGGVTVLDYKTGYRFVSARQSGQLQLLGLSAARAYGLPEVCVSVLQIDGLGEVRRSELQLSESDLERAARRVRLTQERIRAAQQLVARGRVPDVSVGEHCERCPAFRACPANIRLARGLISDASRSALVVSELSAEEVGLAWERMTRARRVLDEIEQGLRAYIDHEPSPLPGGEREVARVETTREVILGRGARPPLIEHLGEAASEVVEPTISKSAIERHLCASSATAQEARNRLHGLLSNLRRTGAISLSKVISYRVRKIERPKD